MSRLIIVSLMLVLLVVRLEGLGTKQSGKDGESPSSVEDVKPLRRNVVQFKRMTECTTDRSALDFVGYGCWCGVGGKGETVDDVDKCCKVHDECYNKVEESKACGWPYRWSTYFATYKRNDNDCTGCAPRDFYDDKKEADCKHTLCMCDSTAAKCFGKAKYNKKYKNYNKGKYCH